MGRRSERNIPRTKSISSCFLIVYFTPCSQSHVHLVLMVWMYEFVAYPDGLFLILVFLHDVDSLFHLSQYQIAVTIVSLKMAISVSNWLDYRFSFRQHPHADGP